jgi:hypothetical protein
MTLIIVEIKKRNRDYGLFTWTADLDEKMKKMIPERGSLKINFDGKMITRKVSFKYRKFSISKKKLAGRKTMTLKQDNGHLSLILD